jgi:hypothetical protein
MMGLVQLQMRVAAFAYMGFHQYSATLIIPNYDSVVMLLRHCVGRLKRMELEVLYMLRPRTVLLFCDVTVPTHCVVRAAWTNTLVCGVTLLERLMTPSLVELTLLARSTLTLIALLTFSTIVHHR